MTGHPPSPTTTFILFGSPWNPVSAAAADFFLRHGQLAVVIIPGQIGRRHWEGLPHFLSLALLWLRRRLRVALAGRLHSPPESLNEVLVRHPCPVVVAEPGFAAVRDAVAGLPKDAVMVSCIFPAKIPTDLSDGRPMINIHPGLLPDNAGPSPYFRAVTGQAPAGLTCHELTERFDDGPILALRPLAAAGTEFSLERATAGDLEKFLLQVFGDWEALWRGRSSGKPRRYFAAPTAKERRQQGLRSVFSRSNPL